MRSERIHLAPNIPRNKLQGALGSYAGILDPKRVLLLVDDTIFGGSKEGLLVTDELIIAKGLFQEQRMALFKDVEAFQYLGDELYFNRQQFIKFTHVEADDLGDLIDHLNEHVAIGRKTPALVRAAVKPSSTAGFDLRAALLGAGHSSKGFEENGRWIVNGLTHSLDALRAQIHEDHELVASHSIAILNLQSLIPELAELADEPREACQHQILAIYAYMCGFSCVAIPMHARDVAMVEGIGKGFIAALEHFNDYCEKLSEFGVDIGAAAPFFVAASKLDRNEAHASAKLLSQIEGTSRANVFFRRVARELLPVSEQHGRAWISAMIDAAN